MENPDLDSARSFLFIYIDFENGMGAHKLTSSQKLTALCLYIYSIYRPQKKLRAEYEVLVYILYYKYGSLIPFLSLVEEAERKTVAKSFFIIIFY